MEKTVERSAQEKSAKVLESRAFKGGKSVTVLDTHVREVVDVSIVRRVTDFKETETSLRLFVDFDKSIGSTYYAEELRSAEEQEHQNLTKNFRLREDFRYTDNISGNEARATHKHRRRIRNMSSPVQVFDVNGEINGEPSVYLGTSYHQVEINLQTDFGSKTVVKTFEDESDAEQFRKKMEESSDSIELQIEDMSGPTLCIDREDENTLFGVKWESIKISIFPIIMGFFAPVGLTLQVLLGNMSLPTFFPLFAFALVGNTLPAMAMLWGVLSVEDDDTEYTKETISMNNEVEALDIEPETRGPETYTVELNIEEDSTTFEVVDEPISWTFGATEGYPTSRAIEFAEHIGIENIQKSEFKINAQPYSEDAHEDIYVSDCGKWAATRG